MRTIPGDRQTATPVSEGGRMFLFATLAGR
jgi:hypothetical protein